MTDGMSPMHDHAMTDSSPMPAPAGHHLSPSDPDNPQNWSIFKKIYASAVATAFTFSVGYGITAYTAGITGVMQEFNVSMTTAILGLSLPLFGAFFAPIYTPHLSERFGRAPVYFCSLPPFALFILGSGWAQNWTTLAACRFFAGLFGAPSLVLIEGTYADIWAAQTTVTYYSFLTLASFLGTGFGPIINGFVFAAKDWRWTQWTTLMITLAAYLFGIGMPETYGREIVRTRARRAGVPHKLMPAESGTTIPAMARITIINPLIMIVSDPITILTSLYLGFNFGVLFSFFISIPAVLHLTYDFTIQQIGIAFNAAIAGSLLAAGICILIDQAIFGYLSKSTHQTGTTTGPRIEYRLIPAMVGSILLIVSFFWVANTAAPNFHHTIPIIATAVYVWGNMSVLVSFVSYLFDAYPPAGTLSALTAAACFRIACAGVIPLVIIQMIMGLTGKWTYQTFGIIAIVMAGIPVVLFLFGERWRHSSKYGAKAMAMHMEDMHHGDPEGKTMGSDMEHNYAN